MVCPAPPARPRPALAPAWPSAAALARLLARASAGLASELIGPSGCAACDAPSGLETIFCPPCAGSVLRREGEASPPPSGGLHLVAFGLYGGALGTAIRRFKYAGRADLARPLGHLLRAALRADAREGRPRTERIERVVPVPLHPKRLAERGFNQAALLGSHAASELGASLDARALTRPRPSPPQARRGRADRLGAAHGAFVARRPDDLAGRRVLLVDDVVTTGATLAACAAALRDAGAIVVACAVLAESPAASEGPLRASARAGGSP